MPPLYPPLYALAIWQPWAEAVARGLKDVENRNWPPPVERIGKLLAIHAGLTYDEAGELYLLRRGVALPSRSSLDRGAIIAVARLAGRSTCSTSPWAEHGVWHWLLADVVRLANPVRCRGAQQIWRVPDAVARRVLAQLPVDVQGQR
jgi:hypothetical protein